MVGSPSLPDSDAVSSEEPSCLWTPLMSFPRGDTNQLDLVFGKKEQGVLCSRKAGGGKTSKLLRFHYLENGGNGTCIMR